MTHSARAILLTLSSLLASSCMAVEEVNLERYLEQQSLAMNSGDAPAGARPLSMVVIQQDGFYLFGLIPIAAVQLEDCIEEMAERARKMHADGVANVRAEYSPASALKFSTFPIPDWSASISLVGMAYRIREREESAEPELGPQPEPSPGSRAGVRR